MIKRLAYGLGVVGLIGGVLVAGRLASASAPQSGSVCHIPAKGSYSVGAIVKHGDDIYRCLSVYGNEMTPTGVAWVKGVMVENNFVPQ